MSRKEGLEPQVPFIEINSWTNCAESSDRPEYGFGVTGFVWRAVRRRWWIDGYYNMYRGRESSPQMHFEGQRPRWKKEIFECRRMLHLDVVIWSKMVNVSIRLWRVKWTESTTFS